MVDTSFLNFFFLGAIQSSLYKEEVVEAPNVLMKVTERGGAELQSAQVGDPLELRFRISDYESPYEIFVRDLIAKDGNDQTEISLIDSRGCPSEGHIIGPLTPVPGTNIFTLSADFDAFKFPTSEIVQFRAHVTPCIPRCKPVRCDGYEGGAHVSMDSYGKRRRRRSYAPSEDENGESKVLVTQAFFVSDKFRHGKKKRPEAARNVTSGREDFFQEKESSVLPTPSDICMNLTGILVAVGVLILIQVALGFAWNHIRTRINSSKCDERSGFPPNAVIFNPYDHHARHR
ncbi:Putative LOC100169340 [Caligus rogercresseyi]|uniref:LOC100169340 n=1 Tax=Caligus rogercresseyi TaxID=217165 RepID=A0A7T8GYG3_CALRO|nr:Putative LOC100169340 [Caligus rogercresseyi]